MKAKGNTMKKKKEVEIEYPRHWWFSCSGFTCYLETDKEDKITNRSTGFAKRYVGEKAKRFGKQMQRLFGGVMVDEYDKNGKCL